MTPYSQEDGRYHNLYISLFDDDELARVYTHPTRSDLTACLEGNDAFEKLRWFSRGYFGTALQGGKVVISDLRMGLTPSYVFRFAVAEYTAGIVRAIPPQAIEGQLTSLSDDLNWLADRFVGQPSVRAAEADGTEQRGIIEIATCNER